MHYTNECSKKVKGFTKKKICRNKQQIKPEMEYNYYKMKAGVDRIDAITQVY